MAKVVFLAQIGISVIAFAGDSIFNALNIPPPQIYEQYRDKKMGVIIGAWILGNMIQNGLTQTGAFEIYSSGELVRLPPLSFQDFVTFASVHPENWPPSHKPLRPLEYRILLAWL